MASFRYNPNIIVCKNTRTNPNDCSGLIKKISEISELDQTKIYPYEREQMMYILNQIELHHKNLFPEIQREYRKILNGIIGKYQTRMKRCK